MAFMPPFAHVQRPKEAPLYPNPRQVYIEDSSGHRFPPSDAGQRALEASGVKSTPLTRQLIPGESYITEICFDLPTDIRVPKLYVGDSDPLSALLIGHEESPLPGRSGSGSSGPVGVPKTGAERPRTLHAQNPLTPPAFLGY